MKKAKPAKPQMREQYDFSSGVRGKHAARYAAGTNVVLLDDDVRDVFRDSRSVNAALRALAKIVRSRARHP